MSEDANRDWDPKQVERLVCAYFGEGKGGGIEGPARLGSDYRVWRVWTWGKKEYHAHYAVAYRNSELKFYRDFDPFADFISNRFDADKAFTIEERRHELRLSWVRTISAVIIVMAFLALFVSTIVQQPEKLSIATISSALLGAGIAFLLGPWARRRTVESGPK